MKKIIGITFSDSVWVYKAGKAKRRRRGSGLSGLGYDAMVTKKLKKLFGQGGIPAD